MSHREASTRPGCPYNLCEFVSPIVATVEFSPRYNDTENVYVVYCPLLTKIISQNTDSMPTIRATRQRYPQEDKISLNLTNKDKTKFFIAAALFRGIDKRYHEGEKKWSRIQINNFADDKSMRIPR